MPCLGAHGLGMLLASTVRSSSIATSHGIAPMANPSWCTGHCAFVLCVGIMRVSQLLSSAPLDHDIAPMASSAGSPHKAEAPSCLRGEEVGHTRPHAFTAMRCTPHMSWSPCVYAHMSSVCPRHAQGRAIVPPWCGQSFPLMLHYSSLKSNTGRFHSF